MVVQIAFSAEVTFIRSLWVVEGFLGSFTVTVFCSQVVNVK